MNHWEIRRRDFLKSLGVGLGCLPLLHSSDAFSAPGDTPKRLVIVANTEGYRQALWRPKDGSLLTQTLPDSSSPMEKHKADLIYLPGMTHPSFTGNQHGAFPNHLTAGPNSGVGEYRVAYSPSVDQVIGPAIATANGLTRATLNLGILSNQGIMGEGTNSKWCIYKGKDQPVIPEQDPWKTYAQVFGAATGTTDVAMTRLLAQRKSLLDYVGNDLTTFSKRLGSDDRAIVGGHLQALRDLEKQLAALPSSSAMCATSPGSAAVSTTDSNNYPALVKVSMDLMVAALKCDVTRVTTLQMVDAGGGHLTWNWLAGIGGPGLGGDGTPNGRSTRNWHDLAHNPITTGIDMKAITDKWLMGQFAELLDRMKAIPEGTGTMLSNSVVLFTNHMEDGSNHNVQKLPWILAGQCGGFFKTGVCALSAGKPINGVLAETCNAMGVPVEFFGDASFGKPWAGLRA